MGYQNNDRPEEIDELLLDAMFDLDDLRYENGMSAESIESSKLMTAEPKSSPKAPANSI
jgi:hypothetical protein